MDRFSQLSFSVGCASQSSVAVVHNQAKHFSRQTPPSSRDISKMKNTAGMLPLPKPNISAGLHKLIKSLKNLSHIFAIYRNEEDEEEMEMVIGLPTDVQHVTHIGLDNDNGHDDRAKSNKGDDKSFDDDNIQNAELFTSLHSLTLSQFELVMASRSESSLARASFGLV